LVEDPGCCPVGISSSGPCGSADNVLPIVLRSKTRSDSDCLVSTRHLSWGFQRSSLHRHQPATSTPAFLPRLPAAFPRFGPLLPRAGLVPPSRFLTALTAFSVVDSAGLLHPAADPGIHRVSGRLLRPCGFKKLACHDAGPFEAFPSPAAIRSLRIPTLSPFAIQGWSDLGVFFRWSSPLPSVSVSRPERPMLPWVCPCRTPFVFRFEYGLRDPEGPQAIRRRDPLLLRPGFREKSPKRKLRCQILHLLVPSRP
jgi:hypothetical protein